MIICVTVLILVMLQVQVQFLEARNLDGLGQNPVVKVLCGRKVMMTSVQKGTNKPIWNEVGWGGEFSIAQRYFSLTMD